MCEIVVWKVSQQQADPYLDAQAWKEGDVICVLPDGHTFSAAERGNPDWLIVKLPGVPESDLASLVAEEPETDPARPNRMRQRRMFHLETAKKLKTHADVMAARVKKPRRQDPNVIG